MIDYLSAIFCGRIMWNGNYTNKPTNTWNKKPPLTKGVPIIRLNSLDPWGLSSAVGMKDFRVTMHALLSGCIFLLKLKKDVA